jgi:hypothetical protein
VPSHGRNESVVEDLVPKSGTMGMVPDSIPMGMVRRRVCVRWVTASDIRVSDTTKRSFQGVLGLCFVHIQKHPRSRSTFVGKSLNLEP